MEFATALERYTSADVLSFRKRDVPAKQAAPLLIQHKGRTAMGTVCTGQKWRCSPTELKSRSALSMIMRK